MKNDDDALGRDLVTATGRDLPGEEFVDRVMGAIEDGGGERTISAGDAGPRLRRLRGPLAAAVLVGLGVWAVASGRLVRPADGTAPGEGAPAATAAGEGEAAADGIELPRARTAVPDREPIRISLGREGVLRMEGIPADGFEELRRLLLAKVGRASPGAPSDRDVVLRIDRSVRWREVQWLMQTCAHPEVSLWRLHFEATGPEGTGRLPVFLPRDRGLGKLERVIEDPVGEDEEARREAEDDADFRIAVTLKRRADETATRVDLGGRPIGLGEPGLAAMGQEVRRLLESGHGPVEIDAFADVPYEDVVRTVDAVRLAGAGDILFVGAPPPK